MYAFEIQYREKGVLKCKGFKDEEKYRKFLKRTGIEIIRCHENCKGGYDSGLL